MHEETHKHAGTLYLTLPVRASRKNCQTVALMTISHNALAIVANCAQAR